MNEEPLDFSWATYKDPDRVDYYEKPESFETVSTKTNIENPKRNIKQKEIKNNNIVKTNKYTFPKIDKKKKEFITRLSAGVLSIIVLNFMAANVKKISASNDESPKDVIETTSQTKMSEENHESSSVAIVGEIKSEIPVSVSEENKSYDNEKNYIIDQANKEDHTEDNCIKSYSSVCINVPEKAANYLTDDVYNMVINNFGKYIKKYSEMYGVDPNVVAGLIMVESPDYDINNDYDYHKIGLGQYKGEYFDNDTFRTFNYDKNEIESYTVHVENLYANPEEQIKMICITLATSAKQYDYNLAAILEHHNKGCGSVNTSLNKIMNEKGYASKKDVLLYEDQNEIIKNMPELGDPRYSYKIAYCANKCIENHAFGDEDKLVFKDHENNTDHIIDLSINRFQRS